MGPAKWSYRVRPQQAAPHLDYFEFDVVEHGSAAVRVVMMNNHRQAHLSGKGILDALIPRVAAELGRQVQSSPESGQTKDIYRTPDATKAWERLRSSGIATYDGTTDIYSAPV